MNELIDVATNWWSLPLAALIVSFTFGFAPGFVLRLIVLIYPKDDPRRNELVAQLYVLGRLERLLFVGEQLETALLEGIPHRLNALRNRKKARSSEDNEPQGTVVAAPDGAEWPKPLTKLPPAPPLADPPAKPSGTTYTRALGWSAVWNTLPAALIVTGLMSGGPLSSTHVTRMISVSAIATFAGGLILWRITKHRYRSVTWLVLVAMLVYVSLFAVLLRTAS